MSNLLSELRERRPLVHCMTNIVVANFQANGLLALGASPVMADAYEEAEEMAASASCTVLNIGTLHRESLLAMEMAGKAANGAGTRRSRPLRMNRDACRQAAPVPYGVTVLTPAATQTLQSAML